MQLNIHTLDDAPADSRPVLEGIAADLGLVPNLAAAAPHRRPCSAASTGCARR